MITRYWEARDFICPIKMQTIEFVKDCPVYFYVLGYEWFYGTFVPSILLFTGFLGDLTVFSTEIEPIMKFFINGVAILFGTFRAISMGVAAYKAWRDRKLHE
jgi:hypothetical protein